MKAKHQTANSTLEPSAAPSEGSAGRHYLGLWHLDVGGDVDYLGCAWREQGMWYSRCRWRCDGDEPMRYEERQEDSHDWQSAREAQAAMIEHFVATNVLHHPITYHVIDGDTETAMRMIFSKPQLLAWGMDNPTLPIVPAADAARLDQISQDLRKDLSQGRGFARCREKLGKTLAAVAKRPIWQPDRAEFWVLDLTVVWRGNGWIEAMIHSPIPGLWNERTSPARGSRSAPRTMQMSSHFQVVCSPASSFLNG